MKEHAYAIETWHSGYLDEDGNPSECWLWKGNLNPVTVYGQARHSAYSNTQPAHRVIYELINGPVPDLSIDHLCGIRQCVRPEHLEAVSAAENTHRSRNVCTLDWSQVEAIRASDLTNAVLADLFGVNASTISRVRSGKTWKVPDAA